MSVHITKYKFVANVKFPHYYHPHHELNVLEAPCFCLLVFVYLDL